MEYSQKIDIKLHLICLLAFSFYGKIVGQHDKLRTGVNLGCSDDCLPGKMCDPVLEACVPCRSFCAYRDAEECNNKCLMNTPRPITESTTLNRKSKATDPTRAFLISLIIFMIFMILIIATLSSCLVLLIKVKRLNKLKKTLRTRQVTTEDKQTNYCGNDNWKAENTLVTDTYKSTTNDTYIKTSHSESNINTSRAGHRAPYASWSRNTSRQSICISEHQIDSGKLGFVNRNCVGNSLRNKNTNVETAYYAMNSTLSGACDGDIGSNVTPSWHASEQIWEHPHMQRNEVQIDYFKSGVECHGYEGNSLINRDSYFGPVELNLDPSCIDQRTYSTSITCSPLIPVHISIASHHSSLSERCEISPENPPDNEYDHLRSIICHPSDNDRYEIYREENYRGPLAVQQLAEHHENAIDEPIILSLDEIEGNNENPEPEENINLLENYSQESIIARSMTDDSAMVSIYDPRFNNRDGFHLNHHDNNPTYEILQGLPWVMGYHSEGSSISVYVQEQERGEDELLNIIVDRTRQPSSKFKLRHM